MAQPEWQPELGARVLGNGRARFCVYAPGAESLDVEIYPWPGKVTNLHPMAHQGDGVWGAEIEAPPGTLYRYRLNDDWAYPDPYSRSQPEDVHGPSAVVDPAFPWSDEEWAGVDPDRLVIYELHIGTFTPNGTFDAAIEKLDYLRDLGINAIELMPVAEFPGTRNWGYDGAHRFAPESSYGGPEGLRRFVDAAHARGLGVMLDVVYNHLGPDGDYLGTFVPEVYTDRYHTPWGKAINFDGQGSAFVRKYFLDNVLFWMHEYHIDGFRIDAAHEIYDSSEIHILRELAAGVHRRGPRGRRGLVIAEHERQELRVVAPARAGGFGLDGMWVDDFHHSMHVRMTGEKPGYLTAYQGTTAELAQLVNEGFVYASGEGIGGEAYAHVLAEQLVYCVQNHDQIGNRPFGARITEAIGLERYKAAYALMLLLEETPLIFMGDEYAASTPFLYFTDHNTELAAKTRAGRRVEFRAVWASQVRDDRLVPDAQADRTHRSSKLNWGEQAGEPHAGMHQLIAKLLAIRRDDVVFAKRTLRSHARAVSQEVLAVERGDAKERRLVLVNFGDTTTVKHQGSWKLVLSTAEARFAGPGTDAKRVASSAVALPPHSTTVWKSS